MAEPTLKLAEIYATPKAEVLKCLHKLLDAIESGKVDPRQLVMVIARVNPDKDDDSINYNIRSSNLTSGEMFWMFEVGKRYCFDGDKAEDDE
jgi:hypothetical protein